ncbi:protein lifeguard 4-like isoform X1 [Ditylenchus destructor]|nr:protein lifeguard 4-like isoform X1 [Ditylenchus destructor]
MASIPLLSDQDIEQGELPTYEDTINGSKNTSSRQDSTATRTDSAPRQKRLGGLFSKHFDDVQDANSVAFAHVSIRLGFLRKVLGILSFQFVVTVAFCTALYMTPGVKGFLQQQ